MPSADSPKRKPPTQRAIAAAAGVAQETVSHILNGTANKRYSAATEENVRRIAAEMRYVPNRASRTMRKGRSNLIAVIHFGSRYRTGQEAVSYLPQAVRMSGYDYLVNDLQWYGNTPDRVVGDLIAAGVEGVIMVGNQQALLPDACVERLVNAGIAVVSLYGVSRNLLLKVPLICGDVSGNHETLTRHLVSVGHRRILGFVSDSESRLTEGRVTGFQKALAGRGTVSVLPEERFFSQEQPWSADDAPHGILLKINPEVFRNDVMRMTYDRVIRLHKTGVMPEAIMAVNDQAALGVFAAAMELGLRIPGDLAVTGVDNDPFGAYPAFRLTTLEPDSLAICEAAVETVLGVIQGNPVANYSRKAFISELIVRGSCGAGATPSLASSDSVKTPTLPLEK